MCELIWDNTSSVCKSKPEAALASYSLHDIYDTFAVVKQRTKWPETTKVNIRDSPRTQNQELGSWTPVWKRLMKQILKSKPWGSCLESFCHFWLNWLHLVNMWINLCTFRYAKGSDPDNWLTVDEKTGDIRLNKAPDRESKYLVNGTYYAKVLCMSQGKCSSDQAFWHLSALLILVSRNMWTYQIKTFTLMMHCFLLLKVQYDFSSAWSGTSDIRPVLLPLHQACTDSLTMN